MHQLLQPYQTAQSETQERRNSIQVLGSVFVRVFVRVNTTSMLQADGHINYRMRVLLHTKQNVHQCVKLEPFRWRAHQACHPPKPAWCYPLHSYKWENNRNIVYTCVIATGVFTGLGVKTGSAAITQRKKLYLTKVLAHDGIKKKKVCHFHKLAKIRQMCLLFPFTFPSLAQRRLTFKLPMGIRQCRAKKTPAKVKGTR